MREIGFGYTKLLLQNFLQKMKNAVSRPKGHLSTVRSATKRKPGSCRPNTAHTDTVVYIDEVAELICSRDEPAWD